MSVAFIPTSYTEPTPAVVIASSHRDAGTDDKTDSNLMQVFDGTTLGYAVKAKNGSTSTPIPEWKSASLEDPIGSLSLGRKIELKPLVMETRKAAESNSQASRVMRAHFGKNILSELGNLREYSGTPNAATSADTILRAIRRFRDEAPSEPFLEIVMALHDAMAFENRWIDYSAAQYEGASKILFDYVNQELDNPKIEKAIQKLTYVGFDTLPFDVDFSEDELETSRE